MIFPATNLQNHPKPPFLEAVPLPHEQIWSRRCSIATWPTGIIWYHQSDPSLYLIYLENWYIDIYPSIYIPYIPLDLDGPENCGPSPPQAALRLVSADPCARTAPRPRSRPTGPQRPGSFTSRGRGLGSFLRQWGGQDMAWFQHAKSGISPYFSRRMVI